MADLRTAGWAAIRKARNVIDHGYLDALASADRAEAAGDRNGEAWWRGRADAFKAADTVLLAMMKSSKLKKVRR